MQFNQVFRPVPIDGADGYYVGDQGGILSGRSPNGQSSRLFDSERVLRRIEPGTSQWGHKVVSFQLYPLDGRRFAKTFKVHRLVLMTFLGPCPEGMEACHFPDRDVSNNRLENLRWDTKKANAFDQYLHGTRALGSRNGGRSQWS
jgi:hypothetical protein